MAAKTFILTNVCMLCVLLPGLAVTSENVAEETRTSTSVHYTRAQRDAGLAGSLSKDEHSALKTQAKRDAPAVANNDFWFYDADVLLFNDHDVDGHFHGIDLLFDADTYFQSAEVYAVVYLSLDGGPWNEYSATDNFTLFGSSADDEFNIVTELVSGYPTGSYDLLIELFDGFNDDFLASFGPVDTSELAFLPLEDSNRDVPFVPPPTTVVVHDGGGALGWPTILALILSIGLLGKLREKRAQQAVVRVQLATQTTEEIQASRVRLDDRFRP